MAAPATSPHRHRFSLPDEPGRRAGTQSLLMVAATAVAAVVAGIVGTFLQLVVFHLDDQELLPEAGPWGYVAGVSLLVLMTLPAVVGVGLGVRARHLGERSLGITGVVVNGVIAAYLGVTLVATLLVG